MIQGHGGDIYGLAGELGCAPCEIDDMSSNVNPLGPPDGLMEFLMGEMDAVRALPEPDARSAVRAFSERHGLDPATVLAGNGTTELIHTLPLALSSRRVLILCPTYADYADACRMHGVSFTCFFTEPERRFHPNMEGLRNAARTHDTVFICNPNNPTGVLLGKKEILGLARSLPETRFVIDESYLPFVSESEAVTLIRERPENMIVLNSMSKIFRIPGLRIGFLTAGPALMKALGRYALPWSVNGLAQRAAWFLMTSDAGRGFVEKSRSYLDRERAVFEESLSPSPLITLFPSCTSFILAELGGAHSSGDVCASLARNRILIRNCSNFSGLTERFIRVSLKTSEVNRRLVRLLSEILQTG